MDEAAFEHHLTSPQGKAHIPTDAITVTVGGGECCDTVTISLQTDGEHLTDAGFSADGCGASHAAASAAVALARGRDIIDVARIGPTEIATELGGLSVGKRHAADVAAEALHRALGQLVRERGSVTPPDTGSRTLIAMSGGVDSSVAALLCAREGDVVAVTLELWGDPENDSERSCCSASAVAQARSLAHSLGLPHFTLDLRSEFRAIVVEPFIEAYGAGETPNPCVGCNGHLRLDAMLDFGDRLGCETLATGHYARVASGTTEGGGEGPLLRAAADANKDQTYMLAALSPQSLARMRFPLGDLTKPEVRAIAADAALSVANKHDSQDLCFLAGTSRARFIERHGAAAPSRGDVVTEDGTAIGHHHGHELFTVGQRRGIRVAAPDPLYVLAKDAATNRVVVGPRDRLLAGRVRIRGAQLHDDGARVDRVKLRYRSHPLPARIDGVAAPGRHRELSLDLEEPIAGAAPGQMACLMAGDVVIGWGTITA